MASGECTYSRTGTLYCLVLHSQSRAQLSQLRSLTAPPMVLPSKRRAPSIHRLSHRSHWLHSPSSCHSVFRSQQLPPLDHQLVILDISPATSLDRPCLRTPLHCPQHHPSAMLPRDRQLLSPVEDALLALGHRGHSARLRHARVKSSLLPTAVVRVLPDLAHHPGCLCYCRMLVPCHPQVGKQFLR